MKFLQNSAIDKLKVVCYNENTLNDKGVKMKINQIAKISPGQDGAIWKNQLFRFDDCGKCSVYDLRDIENGILSPLVPIGSFVLDKSDLIVPHSNAVSWGIEFFAPGDEYPLLYSNIYNNYADVNDDLTGVCCVYRVERSCGSFKTTLVQLIKIGFTDDPLLWKVHKDRSGVRPYGNFVIDRDAGYYYAFVMRDEELGTRYFKFKIPTLLEGEMDETFGVKKVVLTSDDICDTFDCSYHRFIQGATVHGNRIYSTEGFNNSAVNRPALRVIEPASKAETMYLDFFETDYKYEPEMIDFYNGICYYSDAYGNLYTLEF